jgi:hypothetical protein
MLKKIFNPQFWMPLVILGLSAGLVTFFWRTSQKYVKGKHALKEPTL